jgi:hypothetical protein
MAEREKGEGEKGS